MCDFNHSIFQKAAAENCQIPFERMVAAMSRDPEVRQHIIPPPRKTERVSAKVTLVRSFETAFTIHTEYVYVTINYITNFASKQLQYHF